MSWEQEDVAATPDALPSPAGLNIVVYDLEIKKSIGDVVATPEGPHTIGWRSYAHMGISVGVLYDYRTGDFSVHLDEGMGALVDRLNSADLVVGFNHLGFDNNLLRGSGFDLKESVPQYDLLYWSRRSLGWREGQQFPQGCKLDHHLEATFGKKLLKTGHGELAPKLYQAGKMSELISYCIADVRREAMCFEHVWERGWISTLTHGRRFIRHPWLSLRKAS